LERSDFKNIPNLFFPSLFQEKIKKKFEIRVFFLLGECYSMAIFSQNDDETKVDFRRYNLEKQNYRVPYNLPENIKNKIKIFMKNQGLNTGSLDIILSEEMKYYFLEVNPVGQFGMVSYPCNFKLEKRIAEKLITIH
jgi:glutathione synthase/RimK-type ligase-like ATP-grasp enzyme